MTARLTVAGGPARGSEFPLEGRIIFNIGRDPTATIPIDDPQLAPTHCRLYREEDRFTIFDVSGAGMTVNGKRLVKAELRPGDRIQIGSTELVFTADAGSPVRPPAAPAAPAAVAPGITSGDFRIDVQASDDPNRPVRVWLQCVEGNDKGKVFDLSEGNVWVIGRGHSADVTVMDIKASRAHCRIDRVGDAFYINDLNSTNGTYVNGQQVERQLLSRGDYIKVGYTIFAFQYETAAEAARRSGTGVGFEPQPKPATAGVAAPFVPPPGSPPPSVLPPSPFGAPGAAAATPAVPPPPAEIGSPPNAPPPPPPGLGARAAAPAPAPWAVAPPPPPPTAAGGGIPLDLSALDDADPAPPPAAAEPSAPPATPPACFLCLQPISFEDLRAGRYREIHGNHYCLGCVDGL